MFEKYYLKAICTILLALFFVTSVGAADQLPEVMVGQSRVSWSLATSNSVVSFNGSGDNVNLGNPSKISSMTGSFSVEFWYKFSNPNPSTYPSTHPYGGSGWSGILAKGDGGSGGNDGFLFYIMPFGSATNHSIALRSNAGGTDIGNVGIAANVSNDVFHHVAYVFDNTSKRITTYFDGVSYNYKDMPSDFYPKLDNSRNIYVGCWIPDGNSYFKGSVDELRIYDRVLGGAEIAQNYVGTYDNGSSLKGYWNFNGNYADSSLSPAPAGTGNAPFVADSYGAGETIYGGYSGNEAILNFGQSGKEVGKSLAPSASFNGTNAVMDAGNASILSGTGEFAISLWFKRNGTTGSSQMLATQISGSHYSDFKLEIDKDTNQIKFRTYGPHDCNLAGTPDQGEFNITSSAAVSPSDSSWHFLIAQRVSAGSNSTKGYLWLDGQKVAESSASSGIVCLNNINEYNGGNAPRLGIGGQSIYVDQWNPYEYFAGNISTVRTYTRSLSSEEITSLYTESNVPTSGLGGYWKLNDGSGTTIADSSGNNHSATFNNGAWSEDGPLLVDSGTNNELVGFEKDLLKKCANTDLAANPVRCFTLNANSSGVKIMTSRTSVNYVPVTEIAAIMYSSKTIMGDVYDPDSDMNNFAFWGRSLHQSNTDPTSDAAYKIGSPLNDFAQAKWNGVEFQKNDSKITTLKGEAPLLSAANTGSGGTWYMQSVTDSVSPSFLDDSLQEDSDKTPEGKVWYVDGNLTISNNATYRGKGTIIVGGNLTVNSGVNIKPYSSGQNRLGFIVMGSTTASGNNKVRAAIYCKNTITVGSNSDFTGSFVANTFGGLTNNNIRFYYDYDLDNAWPPGFRYLNMPHAESK